MYYEVIFSTRNRKNRRSFVKNFLHHEKFANHRATASEWSARKNLYSLIIMPLCTLLLQVLVITWATPQIVISPFFRSVPSSYILPLLSFITTQITIHQRRYMKKKDTKLTIFPIKKKHFDDHGYTDLSRSFEIGSMKSQHICNDLCFVKSVELNNLINCNESERAF